MWREVIKRRERKLNVSHSKEAYGKMEWSSGTRRLEADIIDEGGDGGVYFVVCGWEKGEKESKQCVGGGKT